MTVASRERAARLRELGQVTRESKNVGWNDAISHVQDYYRFSHVVVACGPVINRCTQEFLDDLEDMKK